MCPSPADRHSLHRSTSPTRAREGTADSRPFLASHRRPVPVADGDWRFRLLPGAPGTPGAAACCPPARPWRHRRGDFDDSAWASSPYPPTGCSRATALRPPDLHERAVPVPDRPAARAGREPHRRLPPHVRPARRLDGADAVVLRFDGVESLFRVWVNGDEIGVRRRQPARPGVRRDLRGAPGRQRRRGPRAPVVGGQLRRRPGPVVAAGHLPRRHPASPGRPAASRTSGCGPRSRLRRSGAGTSSRRSPPTAAAFPVPFASPNSASSTLGDRGRRCPARRRRRRALVGRDRRGCTTPPWPSAARDASPCGSGSAPSRSSATGSWSTAGAWCSTA